MRDSGSATRELSEGELITLHEESGLDKKDDVPEEVMPANNFKIKEAFRDILQTESKKIKCWKLIET